MTRLTARLTLGLLLALLVYTAASLYADLSALGRSLDTFAWWRLAPVLCLTLLAYALRFYKWQLLLGRVGVRPPAGLSARIFVAGFSMGITPGKVGELIKAWMLRDAAGVPVTRTAPVVVADRLTDLVALLALCLAGATDLAQQPAVRTLLILAALAVLALAALLASPRALHGLLRALSPLPLLGNLARRALRGVVPMTQLLRPAPLGLGSALATAAWLLECVGFFLILGGLPGQHPSLPTAVFIYAAATVLGALSFLPGGLGVTEGGIALMLVRAGVATGRAPAVAATLLVRLCTLWFGVLCGFAALGSVRRRLTALRQQGTASEAAAARPPLPPGTPSP